MCCDLKLQLSPVTRLSASEVSRLWEEYVTVASAILGSRVGVLQGNRLIWMVITRLGFNKRDVDPGTLQIKLETLKRVVPSFYLTRLAEELQDTINRII